MAVIIVYVFLILLVYLIQELIYRFGGTVVARGKNLSGRCGADLLVHYRRLGNQRSKVAEPGRQGAFAESGFKSEFNIERKCRRVIRKSTLSIGT